MMRILMRCIPRSPKTADGWTNALVWVAVIGVPVAFIISYYSSRGFSTPSSGFVWAAPWIVAYPFWFAIQMLFLAISSQRTAEDISYWETFISIAAPVSCLLTMVVLIMLWMRGEYNFGPFQWNMMLAFLSAAALNCGIGGAVRFALKGRLFGQINTNSHDN